MSDTIPPLRPPLAGLESGRKISWSVTKILFLGFVGSLIFADMAAKYTGIDFVKIDVAELSVPFYPLSIPI